MSWKQKGLDKINSAPDVESVKDLEWSKDESDLEDTLHTSWVRGEGRLTVLDRMTGFGYRDIETGFCDIEGKFWLASGGFDIRDHPDKTPQEAIAWVKTHANNCTGD